MQNQFKNYDMNNFRIEAYSPNDNIIKFLIRKLRLLRDAEFCCFLSHIKAVHQSYLNGDNYCIVMEDNVELEHFYKNINNIEKLFDIYDDWECINLLVTGPEVKLKSLYKEYEKKLLVPYIKKKYVYGTKVLLYNRKGMERILKIFPTIDENIKINNDDKYQNRLVSDIFIFEKCNTYLSTFPYGNFNCNFKTTIHKNNNVKIIKNLNELIKKFHLTYHIIQLKN